MRIRFDRLVVVSTFAIIAVVTTFSQNVFATVDMKNANYTESWIDIQLAGSGYALKVQRTYNSRSVFSGMFGFGWCSDFETTIEKTPEGTLKLQECGAGQEVTYRAQAAGGVSMQKTIDQIVAFYKKTNPNSGENSIEKTSVDAAWRAAVDALFEFCDRDGNGTLSETEPRSSETKHTGA